MVEELSDDEDVENEDDVKPYNREDFVDEDIPMEHQDFHLTKRNPMKMMEKIILNENSMDYNRWLMDVVNDALEEDKDVSNDGDDDDDHKDHWPLQHLRH